MSSAEERDRARAVRGLALYQKIRALMAPTERFVIVLVNHQFPYDLPAVLSDYGLDEAEKVLERAASTIKNRQGIAYDVPKGEN